MINGFAVVKNNYRKIIKLLSILKFEIGSCNDFDKKQYEPIKNNKYCVAKLNMSRIELKDLFFINDSRLRLVDFILHEIGHFSIVGPNRRWKNNFGYNNDVNKKTSIKYELEECKATMIENELKRLFGFKYRKNLYDRSNVSRSFIKNNTIKLKLWWESEGKILAKTYFNLV